MSKKFLFAAIAAFIPFAANAEGIPAPAPVQAVAAPTDYFSGFYAGAGIGVAALTAKIDDLSTVADQEGIEEEHTELHGLNAGHHGVVGKLFAGYGQVFGGNYYLGAELFGQLNGLNYTAIETSHRLIDSNDFVNESIKVKNAYSFGLLARAGYLMDPKTMIYVVAGPEWSKFEIKDDFGITDAETHRDSHISPVNDFSVTKLGLMTGLGIEHHFTESMSVRAQYNYSFYPKFDHTATAVEIESQPVKNDGHLATSTTSVHPVKSQFTVDLAYKF